MQLYDADDKLHRLVIGMEKLVSAIEQQPKTSDVRQLETLMKDMRFIIELHEQKLMEKVEELGATPDKHTLNYLSSALQRIDDDIRELKHKPLGTPIKNIEQIKTQVNTLDDEIRVTDEDFIAVISEYKKRVQAGKIKPMPKWAKDERKEAINSLDSIVQKASDVMIAKALKVKPMNFTELTRAVDAPQSVLRKSLALLMKQNKIEEQNAGKSTVYSLV